MALLLPVILEILMVLWRNIEMTTDILKLSAVISKFTADHSLIAVIQ